MKKFCQLELDWHLSNTDCQDMPKNLQMPNELNFIIKTNIQKIKFHIIYQTDLNSISIIEIFIS